MTRDGGGKLLIPHEITKPSEINLVLADESSQTEFPFPKFNS